MESACNVYISQISIRIVLPTDVIAMLKRHYESKLHTCDIHWKEQAERFTPSSERAWR